MLRLKAFLQELNPEITSFDMTKIISILKISYNVIKYCHP